MDNLATFAYAGVFTSGVFLLTAILMKRYDADYLPRFSQSLIKALYNPNIENDSKIAKKLYTAIFRIATPLLIFFLLLLLYVMTAV